MRNQIFIAIFFVTLNCNSKKPEVNYSWKTIQVTATAYNSLPSQTYGNPIITAYGDSLKPGMKCIAISRDLMSLGLTRNTPVAIQGLEGLYIVNDKMHSRWRNRIDIYMGEDVQAARAWGRRKVEITYGTINETIKQN
ncbi:3D domain-containing protein [Hanstruepera marina]|uniref:3D domain-containing protein n=1 Tax=Hanstruepera marina TaxID=2873265 RepID=UPI001CA6624A|nr:3D domain-containing protein [Hanstruepera marina]